MNKMLIGIFDNETAAESGLQALRQLHTAGDITLYATGVVSRDAQGIVSIRKPLDGAPNGAVAGLAVGSLIGLLAGPAGMVAGAVTGGLVGAVRDFWVAGVGLDFVEEAEAQLLPGKVALVAEIEEDWIIPVDAALEGAGGRVIRRTRTEVAEAQFRHDIAAFKSEIKALETEALHSSGAASAKLKTALAASKSGLDAAVRRAQARGDTLQRESDAKAESLRLQLSLAQADVKDRIEERVRRVKLSYHARSAKLSHAWGLTKQALAL